MESKDLPTVTLTEILRWKRPAGSETTRKFCETFLQPVMGEPDAHGNYIHTVYNKDGSYPNIAFTAHHDTVHRDEGMQHIVVNENLITSVGSSCLGADCGTGVWLILGMIDYQVPGVYIVFAAEEIGCVGSSAMVKDNPDWLKNIEAMISFDRKGYYSVITHQLGSRTCSDEFGLSLAAALGENFNYELDTGGAYTDSNEFIDLIGECTNISVGYFAQHTAKESQDLVFAYELLEALVSADWSSLVFKRQPGEIDPADNWGKGYWSRNKHGSYTTSGYDDDYVDWWNDPTVSVQTTYQGKGGDNADDLKDLIENFPDELAQVLDEWGVDAEYLYDCIKPYVRSQPYSNRKLG